MSLIIEPSSYLGLPSTFYEKNYPSSVSNPKLLKLNHSLAGYLNIKENDQSSILALCAGNLLPPTISPIALAYAGHQFGHYTPLLGDGRASMLGEIKSSDGLRWDIQLKGSGKTIFSRQGDGRAPLTSVLREYLISEAMYALGISTTRCLAVVSSEDKIFREDRWVALGVLSRIASSHLRVGSFQYAYYHKNKEQLLEILVNYAINKNFPYLQKSDFRYSDFFIEVLGRQIKLIVDWMSVGFIHGVMNTDNVAISGETLDYGPCAFMDEFNENQVFSSIDINGRYAYMNQPVVTLWNMQQLFISLLPIVKNQMEVTKMQEALDSFFDKFNTVWYKKIRLKLGLPIDDSMYDRLINSLLQLMQSHNPDFTAMFRLLAKSLESDKAVLQVISLFNQDFKAIEWIRTWQSIIKQLNNNSDLSQVIQQMNLVNPAYIPRNHLVNQALENIVQENNSDLFDTLVNVCSNPYKEKANTEMLQKPPLDSERCLQTFCGT